MAHNEHDALIDIAAGIGNAAALRARVRARANAHKRPVLDRFDLRPAVIVWLVLYVFGTIAAAWFLS